MSAEKIIEQIKKDSQREVKLLLDQAESEAKAIIKKEIELAKIESNEIISNGKIHSESIRKILVSKANQDSKRKVTKTKENIIEDCFKIAKNKLKDLKESEYKKIVTKLINEGIKKIGGKCTVKISKELDKKITKDFEIKITGATDAIGGVILTSSNGKIILDNTFEGILNREKNRIRIKVGQLLFK